MNWILAGGLLLRLVVLAALSGRLLAGDAADYHRMAEALAGGVSFEPDWPPGNGRDACRRYARLRPLVRQRGDRLKTVMLPETTRRTDPSSHHAFQNHER